MASLQRPPIVRGYALTPHRPNLFTAARVAVGSEPLARKNDIRGDIRDAAALEFRHPASRLKSSSTSPRSRFVRLSYADPIGTYRPTLIGTAKECSTPSAGHLSVRAVRLHHHRQMLRKPRVGRPLPRDRPPPAATTLFSSKAAPRSSPQPSARPTPVSRLAEHKVALATGGAGNVIGGGDWSPTASFPTWSAVSSPASPSAFAAACVRPWQHVVEPLRYISLAGASCSSANPAPYATAYNSAFDADAPKPVGLDRHKCPLLGQRGRLDQ